MQRQLPLLLRFFNEAKAALDRQRLIPAARFCWPFAWRAWRERSWAALGAVIWFLGYALLYALRLPVTYQYGRYFMPAMPVYFVDWRWPGPFGWCSGSRAQALAWLLARVVRDSARVLIWLAFYGIGAGRYAQDVAIIETEMVARREVDGAQHPARCADRRA